MALIEMLRYILNVGDIDPVTVVQLAGQLDPAVQESVMTAAERLRQEGLQQGIAQGMQQGMQQGIVRGETAPLSKQLRRKSERVPDNIEQRLTNASTDELERYGERILTAKTLDEVFS